MPLGPISWLCLPQNSALANTTLSLQGKCRICVHLHLYRITIEKFLILYLVLLFRSRLIIKVVIKNKKNLWSALQPFLKPWIFSIILTLWNLLSRWRFCVMAQASLSQYRGTTLSAALMPCLEGKLSKVKGHKLNKVMMS